MKLLDKMGLTMEDVKAAQKKAASEKGKVKKTAPKQEKKQNKVVIRNTGTAMGKALAAAMGNMALETGKGMHLLLLKKKKV